MLPTVDFFGTPVTRLVLGDNPFLGHSYIQQVHSGEEMKTFYTAQACVRALFIAQEQGINTYIALAEPKIFEILRQYRRAGGTMNILFQSYPPADLAVNIKEMLEHRPIAIYHQGGSLDYMVETGQVEQLRERLRLIKGTGLPMGLGTHEPGTVLRAEEEGWGVDFYMTCLYNARRTQRGQQSGFITGKPKELVFYPEDRFLMFDVLRKVAKPCIAFKVFAGGQIFCGKKPEETAGIAEGAFRETYANIKPGDLACIGVFQKFKDQLSENIGLAGKVLG